MKKIMFTLMLAVACQFAAAQEAVSIFNDFKNQKKAEYVSIPKVMMSLASLKVKDSNVQSLLQQIRSAKVLTLDDCSKSVRRKFAKRITELTSKGYEEYTRVKDDGDNVLILAKQSEHQVSEIVALITDHDDCMGILVTGNINREDIEAIVSMVGD